MNLLSSPGSSTDRRRLTVDARDCFPAPLYSGQCVEECRFLYCMCPGSSEPISIPCSCGHAPMESHGHGKGRTSVPKVSRLLRAASPELTATALLSCQHHAEAAALDPHAALHAAIFFTVVFARAANFELTAKPSTKEAQAIADELYAGFVSEVRPLSLGLRVYGWSRRCMQ